MARTPEERGLNGQSCRESLCAKRVSWRRHPDVVRRAMTLPGASGHLCAISSLAGTRGLPGAPANCASKAVPKATGLAPTPCLESVIGWLWETALAPKR